MKKGFTLLELLIVIGILAILATATVLVLNPAELLKQARDSQRVSDIGGLNSALSLYVTSVTSPNMASSSAGANKTCIGGGGTFTCYSDRNALLGANCGGRYSNTPVVATSTSRKVDGTGWLPVNLASISGGSPIASLPTDPSNTGSGGPTANPGLYYAYACSAMSTSTNTYVLTAAFESNKYQNDNDLDGKDGGPTSTVYEIGTYPGLDIGN